MFIIVAALWLLVIGCLCRDSYTTCCALKHNRSTAPTRAPATSRRGPDGSRAVSFKGKPVSLWQSPQSANATPPQALSSSQKEHLKGIDNYHVEF